MRKLVSLRIMTLFELIAFGSGVGSDTAQTAPTVAISSPTVDVFTKASVTMQVAVTGEPNTTGLLKTRTNLVARPTVLPALPAPINLVSNGLTDRAGDALVTSNMSLTAPDWQRLGTQPLNIDAGRIAITTQRSLALDSSGNPVVAWNELDGTSGNIYVKRWSGTAWQQVGATFLDANTNKDALTPSLALDSSGNPVVAWNESDGASRNIYVKRWNGTAWKQVGATFLDVNTNQDTFEPSIALDSSGNPVVAWTEFDGTSYNIYVKRWDGTAWQRVGTILDANTDQDTYTPSLTLNSSGNPVVTWNENDGTSDNIYVKRWNGTAWKQVGTTFLDVNTNRRTFEPSMALDLKGNPVVTWSENDGTSDNVYVKRWNGRAWRQIGTILDVNIKQDAFTPSQALDSSGNPVVTWNERDGTSLNVYVKRWNGTAWQRVGTILDLNIKRNAFSPSLALDSSGNPVVTWSENTGNSTGIYVKRFKRIP